MTAILDAITQRVAKRNQTQKIIGVRDFDNVKIDESYFSGTYALYKRWTHTRYLLKRKCVRVGEYVEAPTTLARDYLSCLKLKPARCRGDMYDRLYQLEQLRGNANFFPLSRARANNLTTDFISTFGARFLRSCRLRAGMFHTIPASGFSRAIASAIFRL